MTISHIVLVHGFRGTHHGLTRIVEALSERFICHVPDLPGFGDGERRAQLGIDDYVEWLHGYIDSLGLESPPVLLGHSFGSIVSSHYAARYASTIDQLVLVNPIGAPALEGPRKLLTQLAVFYYWVGSKLPRRLAHAWLSSKLVVMIMSTAMTKTRDKTLRAWIHRQHLTYFSRFHDASSLLQAFKTSVEYSVRDVAAAIPSPTLLVAGERDDITPLEKQRELQTLFTNAQLIVIPEVGHLTHYETPGEVARAIEQFIPS